jgi:hypothetical protein
MALIVALKINYTGGYTSIYSEINSQLNQGIEIIKLMSLSPEKWTKVLNNIAFIFNCGKSINLQTNKDNTQLIWEKNNIQDDYFFEYIKLIFDFFRKNEIIFQIV